MAALAANLCLLAWYKYANFFVDSVNTLAAAAGADGLPPLDIILPIGISFFTFTQIAFLVDCYRGEVREYRFIHYVLFVSYFPHLIAGPVLHHREMMPQFADAANTRPHAGNFAIGLSIFVVGLAKKVLIADNLSPLAIPVFAAGAEPTLIEAWIGVLAYTFQLYFDFSGYSDMAIGLSRLFGVKLPLNFNSPYKAVNIAEFWRRWHMTLSRFLRDYLYIALGGSRRGQAMRYRNLMLTMLLGGLWHGAGWTFVIWGGLHGAVPGGAASLAAALRRGGQPLVAAAAHLPCRDAGLDLFPRARRGHRLGHRRRAVRRQWREPAARPGNAWPRRWRSGAGSPPSTASAGYSWQDRACRCCCWPCCWPSRRRIRKKYLFITSPALKKYFKTASLGRRAWHWRPTRRWSLGFAALFVACIFGMNRVTEFLYFQF